MANVIFKYGTKAQYEALATKDSNALYWLLDTQEIYRGSVLFGTGAEATEDIMGLMSPEDKAALNDLIESGIVGLAPIDASIVLDNDEEGKTIGVQLSQIAGNVLTIRSDGLYVSASSTGAAPSYTMERQINPTYGSVATYRLKQTQDGVASYVGDPIDIPEDLVLESGELKTVETADVPYDDAQVGDKYLDLTLNGAEIRHIYIPVSGLINVYEPGDGIDIRNNTISLKAVETNGLSVGSNGLQLNLATSQSAGSLSAVDKTYIDNLPTVLANKTTQVVEGINGRSYIHNEEDGGGIKYEHSDGTLSFIGANDGGEDGITGQIYSVKSSNGTYIGTRLNMTNEAFYYLPNSDSSVYTADDEIATKGDVRAMTIKWVDLQ